MTSKVISNMATIMTHMPYPYFCDNDLEDVSRWLDNCPLDELIFEFVGENISKFKKDITEMENSISYDSDYKKRVEIIKDLLKEGKVPYAVFVSKDTNFILEGRHRIVAFYQYGLEVIPVYYVSVKGKKIEKNRCDAKEKFAVFCGGKEILRVGTEDEAQDFCYQQNMKLPNPVMASSSLYCHYRKVVIDDQGKETFQVLIWNHR